MLLAVTLSLIFHASMAVSVTVEAAHAAEDTAFDTTVSPLDTRGPWYIENYRTEFYLGRSPTDPNDVRALAFTFTGASALQWYISDHSSPLGRLFSFHTNLTGELGIFVDDKLGNALTVGKVATQFNLTHTKPVTYRITLPDTTLALTAPDTAGSPITLQEIEEGSLAQSWHVYEVPST